MSYLYSLRSVVALLVLGLALGMAPPESRAQTTEDKPTDGSRRKALQEAFTDGDARAVLKDAAGRVEISLFGENSQYSRSQALYVLQDFFERHPPSHFAWRDTSKSGPNHFLSGRYWPDAEEEPLRVHLRLSHSDGAGWQLQEVRVERR